MSTNNRPSHRIYCVTKRANDETNWDEIGAIWPHSDGDGFSIKLSYMLTPGNVGDLVARKIKPKAEADATASDQTVDGGK